MRKVIIEMPIAVHEIKAKLWVAIKKNKINNENSLRDIAKIIGSKESPQQIKHHLETMVNMGTIGKKGGRYDFRSNLEK